MHPGFVGPLTPLVMLEVDEVDEGGILEGGFFSLANFGTTQRKLLGG
jgi:hypothetical protein